MKMRMNLPFLAAIEASSADLLRLVTIASKVARLTTAEEIS